MQYFQTINLLHNPENQIYPGSLSNSNNSGITNNPGFDYFLNQQINNDTINRIEDNQYNNKEFPENKRIFSKNDILTDNVKNNAVENNRTDLKPDEKTSYINSENEKIQKETINPTKKKKENNREFETNKKREIDSESIESREKIRKRNTPTGIDISNLLKNILSLLDKIKENYLNREQLKEVKSAMSEIKDLLFLRKNEIIQNKELLAILKKLKHIIETANKNQNTPVKNQKEIFEFVDLKKQISKLNHEIRQHLERISEKSDNTIGKNNDSNNINNNLLNQKVQAGNSDTEIKDISHKKENSSNQNFQFMKKEIEGESFLTRNSMHGTAKKSGFSEQLNNIVQNAKIFIKDSKNGSFSIRLYPESLGRVNVNLNLEHGVIIGKFLVENAVAREALMENMTTIKERLQENGIAVGEFQVNVRGHNNSQSNFNEEQLLYTGAKEHKSSINNQYELNSYYYHDGEIDLLI